MKECLATLHLIILIFIVGCTLNRSRFESFPDKAQVSLINQKGNITHLGETPLEIKNIELFETDLVQIVFSKKGYKDEKIFVTRPENQTDFNYTIKFKKKDLTDSNDITAQLQEVTTKLARAQNLIGARNFTLAKEILDSIIVKYPNIGLAYDLTANIYFLQGQRLKALRFYKKADELSPYNTTRKRIMRKISSEL